MKSYEITFVLPVGEHEGDPFHWDWSKIMGREVRMTTCVRSRECVKCGTRLRSDAREQLCLGDGKAACMKCVEAAFMAAGVLLPKIDSLGNPAEGNTEGAKSPEEK